ncbi:MAG TPA: DUF885 domain-containing protein [Chitinophagales bacterium]|nr:DUF885 domain-containing protein [Chitinophagales bacterium]
MKEFMLLLTACIGYFNMTFAAATAKADVNFDMYKKAFTERLWKIYPEWASSIGYHKYDAILVIPNKANREKELLFTKEELKRLNHFSLDSLSDLNKIDFHLIDNFLKSSIWQINTLKGYEWNPSMYNVGESFAYILNENYAPLSKRINSIYSKLKNVPAYYEAAKVNIKNPSNEHLQLAIQQNEGALSVFENDFIDSLKELSLTPELKKEYFKRNDTAIAAIKSYIKFLQDFKNEHPRSFRLGSELYAEKFNYEIQSQYSVQEIYEAAEKRKDYLHTEMFKLTTQLWPKYFGNTPMPPTQLSAIKRMIDTISVQHVERANFQTEIEKQLPALIKFVREKNLLYLDPNKPLKVRKEPGYMAGVAGASMSSPGPYEKNGIAYYNVGSLAGWSDEKAESYLREYNKYVLQILNIHEAIPGHYVQLVYSNKAPSIIKSILSNGAMIEGWAVYSELMMLENGYGNNEPEMWLLYYKWNLRSVCNTILDISVHTKNESKDEALDLLMNQAFQQKTEAEGKWHRVQVTSVQLTSYFTEFYEITKLREAYKKKMGNAYKLKNFNEQFLSYGSSPVKYIRQILLSKN